jgi:sugar phosphate isomerase/epimerase
MQLGFVSAIVPDLSLEQVLGMAAELGYDCVEVMCWPPGKADRRYAGVTHLDVTDFTPAAAEQVKKLVADTGVSISGLGYYPNPLTPDEGGARLAVEHIRRVIRASAMLGIGHMNTFVGRDWTKSIDDNWPAFLATWRPLVAYADEQGVTVGIENCPMLFGKDEWPGGKNLATSPAIWRRMFSDLPSRNFGLNFDPSHLVWQHMDYLRPLQEFRQRIFHVHAKDARIDRERLDDCGILFDAARAHTPKLPGLGEVNWGRFFSILGHAGYRGAVCVEVEDRVYEESTATRRAALRQSLTYLRHFIPAADPKK